MLNLYTKTGCPWCKEVRDFLLEKEIPFVEKNVTEDESLFDEMVEKSGQTKAPTLDLNGKILPDAGREEAEEFLKEEGII